MYTEPKVNKNHDFNDHNIVTIERVNKLLFQSIDTLEEILKNQELPTQERATVALKIIEMTGLLSQKNNYSPATLLSEAQQKLNELQINSLGRNGFNQVPEKIKFKPLFLSADYVEIKNFLLPENNQTAIKEAIKRKEQYVESSTTTKADKYRQSYVLFSQYFPELSGLIQSKILEILPEVLTQLEFRPFEISEIEVQLTAHNDGCYYKIHNDAGSEKTASREITYVYYFYQEPKAFSGGELRIYDTELKGGGAINHDNYKTITPVNNSIVFFNSRCRHEVMPVICPSQAFENSRFTVNGWIRRLVS
ncbi:2OG-Fe(II) oxygenase [Trichodesmium erythraeum IMS101]|uniref:2OG-Fe(II) oxygenase n=1 Tax=Trichodesmium erythraeum (strain IMS101) TaxID=203124 RepID=Q10YW7_TRIEI|nr:2OG-Fe(II) oxygenase [Trichodesmium erythraeum GBRTRLIN201]MCH2050836.1 2OG-Fe(II) oxygenase [Trichodesmium sp. ALOHA_ZT_67]MDE5093368.1 2OG-Fe(II) oxygenase [Trichodesmium sp. St11_bin5]MDT9341967.1 2OG-Fe(II) oxygenase [Trichodesmium erythraeum 21-75]